MKWVMEKGNPFEVLLDRYKRELGFLSAELQTIEEVLGEGRFVATVKYDGELSAAVVGPECSAVYNRYGRVRWDFAISQEFAQLVTAAGIGECVAFGELYAVSPEGRPLPLNQTMSIIKKPRSLDQEMQIRLAIFDIYILGEEVLYGRTEYADRFLVVNELFRFGTFVHPAAGRDFVTGDSVIGELWTRHVTDENYEGLVIRANGAIKIKPTFSADVAVVGIFEGKGRFKGTLGGFVLAFMDRDGALLFAGRVGTGFSDEERDTFWSLLRPQVMQEGPEIGSRNGFGQPGNMLVPPTLVVEAHASTFISRLVDSVFWSWDNGLYETAAQHTGWTLQQPRFLRIREDKGVNPDDLRLEQVPIVLESGRRTP